MITIIICFLIADFITGLIHWIEDTYATPSWLLNIGIDNINHHKHPQWMVTMGNFLSRNLITFSISAIIFIITIILHLPFYPCLFIAIFGALGNEVHSWNHRSKNIAIIEFLQDTAIIQTRHQHSMHHKKPYNKAYCTLGNINNAILDRIRFWRILEYILSIFGIKPIRCTDIRDGY